MVKTLLVMFAIIKDRTRQYRVAEGDVVTVDRLPAAVGDKIEFTNVLMAVDGADIVVGNPDCPGISVQAEVLSHDLTPKVRVFKFRRRKNYRREKSHRQPVTVVKILAVKK